MAQVMQIPLSEVIVSLESGARPKGGVTTDSGEIPSLGGEHVASDGSLKLSNVKRISRSFFETLRSGRLQPQDILVVKDGATTGKTGFVRDDFPFQDAAINEHLFLVRLNRERAEPSYVYHYLRSPIGQSSIMLDFRGATVGGISRGFVDKVVLPLPPLSDQRRIGNFLDQAESLRFSRQTALNRLDILRRSIFLDMFANESSEGWTMSTIKEVAAKSQGSIRTGPFGSQLLHSEFVESGIAVLGIDNAVENDFRWAKPRYISQAKYAGLARYTVHPGDVLITIMGTCGRCAIVPDDIPLAINTKHLCCITLDQTTCLPVFLHSYFLLHPLAKQYLKETAKGAVMDGLNMGIIRNLPLRLPPLPVQEEYGRRTSAIESVADSYRQSMLALDELFASLQLRAFRGDL